MPTTQLAVIPFHVLTEGREEASYLGTGLADAITTRLAGTRRIGIRPFGRVKTHDDFGRVLASESDQALAHARERLRLPGAVGEHRPDVHRRRGGIVSRKPL
jgi:hypothetical protein